MSPWRRECLTLMLLTALAGRDRAQAQDGIAPPAPSAAQTLLLEIAINGWKPGMVARFVEEGGRLRIPAEQFAGLGFAPAPSAQASIDGDAWIWLDRLAGLTWTLDRRGQSIALVAPPHLLRVREVSVAPGMGRIDARADWGAMLGWDAFAQWSPRRDDPLFPHSYSVDLDARLFAPAFTLISRNTVYGGAGSRARWLRLESYAEFDNAAQSWRLRLGDSVTRGPVWVRTLRFAGVQWTRDFGLRPDIVTMPVPVLSKEISVPSTFDLFVNGVERYGDSVAPGPVRLRDLPVVLGANTIRTVVVDRSGRRTEMVLPFYAANGLLAKGLSDFSIEAGFPRRRYAVASNAYGPLFASGSAAFAISDTMTLRSYAAAARQFATLGGGATVSLGFATLDGALSYSRLRGADGAGVYVAVSRVSPRITLGASYARGYSYADLARWAGYSILAERATGSLGVNLGSLGQINLIYARQRAPNRDPSDIVSAGYGVDLGRRPRMRLSASGFANAQSGAWGATLSLAIPLGRSVQGFVQHSWLDGKGSAELQLQGSAARNRLDWRVIASGGDDPGDLVDAFARWDGARADVSARIIHADGSTGFQAQLAQSLVAMGGGLHLAGRIDDGFTIAEVGQPRVRVALENRVVGRTGASGRLLLSDLQSYLPNTISIDPLDLPLDASVAATTARVAPRSGAGMVTRFDVRRAHSAIVMVVRSDGTPPPPGAMVRLVGQAFEAPMGYGGEIFVRGLQAGENRLDIAWRDGSCRVRFRAALPEGLPRWGPYRCEP